MTTFDKNLFAEHLGNLTHISQESSDTDDYGDFEALSPIHINKSEISTPNSVNETVSKQVLYLNYAYSLKLICVLNKEQEKKKQTVISVTRKEKAKIKSKNSSL